MAKAFLAVCFILLRGAVSYSQNDSLPPADTLKVPQPSVRNEAVLQIEQPAAVRPEIFKIKKGVDIPLTAVGVAWSLFGFSKIYNKDTSTTAQILALDKNRIAAFNRRAVDHYSQTAFDNSNLFFYGSMPLPLLLLFDKPARKDAVKLGLLYLEAMGITGILYTSAAYFHDKYRPYAYNPEAPFDRRKRGGAKNSFFAGHVALVGTSTFFMASVLSGYHPHSKFNWLWYTIASYATASTAYLRYKAGEHFPTDILIGVGVGTLSGILVPHFHKQKWLHNPNLSIRPQVGPNSCGFSLAYRL